MAGSTADRCSSLGTLAAATLSRDSAADLKVQKRFPSFKPYADKFHEDGFVYNSLEEDFVYMRWKEHFLVPDHHLINVQGASFAGFYYICYQRSTGEISGFYYFHEHLEW